MSLSALSGFANGYAGALEHKKAQKQRSEDNDRMDRYVSAMQSMGAVPNGDMMGGGGSDTMYGGQGNDTMTPFSPAGGNSGYGRAVSYGGGGGDATIVGLLRKHEGAGDPSTLFGHSQRGGRFDGVDVSKMTLAELREFQNPSGEYGQWVKQQLVKAGKKPRVATPAGFGQIVGKTARATQAELGLPDDTVFNEATQTQMVNHLAKQRLIKAKSPAAKRAAMRAEWEGFKHVPDSQLDAAIANFEQNGYGLKPRPLGVNPV